MRKLDGGDVLQGLRVEDCQFAAIGAPVIDVTHQHAVVLCGTAGRWVENELSEGFLGTERARLGAAGYEVVLEQGVGARALPDRWRVAIPVLLADEALVDAGELLVPIVEA
jgi:hypothetical protein